MTNRLFTASGCARCKITRRFMHENGIDYEEHDIKAGGREAFSEFYRQNRGEIYRSQDGVEFPVFTDGEAVRQGVGAVIAYLTAGEGLSGFIGRSTLHGEWIDGINISGGDPAKGEGLLTVLACLKRNNLKIQVFSDGRNAALLRSVLDENLADRAVMDVRGPARLYGELTGAAIDEDELTRSIALTARFPEYRFCTTVAPLERGDGTVEYLTPPEIGETARLIEAATGSKKHPYSLRRFKPELADEDRFTSIEPLPDSAMFKCRTAARRYMVAAEIERQGRR